MNLTPPKRAPAETSICLSFLSGNDIMIAKTGSGQAEGNAPIVVRKDELLGACDPAETRLFSNFSHVCPETVLASIRFFKHKDGIAKKTRFVLHRHKRGSTSSQCVRSRSNNGASFQRSLATAAFFRSGSR